ncbi:type II secretion system protein [bacterium]|nr:type II secretion system protein [bacterium]
MKRGFKIEGFTLAEGSRRTGHFATNFCKTHRLMRSAGFTLAEVLITLGVIGVVAAMTIPTLMANIKGQRYRSLFKKTISTLNQAVRMNQANYDWNFADMNSNDYDPESESQNPETEKTIVSLIDGNLKGGVWLPNFISNDVGWSCDLLDTVECAKDISTYAFGLIGSPVSFLRSYITIDGVVISFYDNYANASYPHNCTQNNKCIGFIVLETNKELEEVHCSDSSKTQLLPADFCSVNKTNFGNVLPFYYFDSTVAPATNAAQYILNNVK